MFKYFKIKKQAKQLDIQLANKKVDIQIDNFWRIYQAGKHTEAIRMRKKIIQEIHNAINKTDDAIIGDWKKILDHSKILRKHLKAFRQNI
jgi:hypothetical protein